MCSVDEACAKLASHLKEWTAWARTLAQVDDYVAVAKLAALLYTLTCVGE